MNIATRSCQSHIVLKQARIHKPRASESHFISNTYWVAKLDITAFSRAIGTILCIIPGRYLLNKCVACLSAWPPSCFVILLRTAETRSQQEKVLRIQIECQNSERRYQTHQIKFPTWERVRFTSARHFALSSQQNASPYA